MGKTLMKIKQMFDEYVCSLATAVISDTRKARDLRTDNILHSPPRSETESRHRSTLRSQEESKMRKRDALLALPEGDQCLRGAARSIHVRAPGAVA